MVEQGEKQMTTSVIVPTYNGAHKIISLLQCLEQQTHPADEVIVVIDGSTDGTADLLKKNNFNFISFRIVEQANGGRAKVRNRGAKEATNDLLIFFDDDMRPDPECIAIHIAHHESNDRSLLSGSQIDKEGDEDIQRYKAMLSRKWSQPLRSKQGRPLKKEEVFLTAANFSIPRVLFQELNGFDEDLTDAEDFDLAVRANAANIPVYYDHRAFALHEDPVTGRSYIKRQRQYRAAHKELFDRFPSRYNSFTLHAPKEPKGLKKFFFRSFCSAFWVNWLDKGSWKKLLPQKLRYKLYDWIITANGVYFPGKTSL